MTAPYSTLAIANEFIELGSECGGIEHMKLQKLLYYAYGWWLVTVGDKHKTPLTSEAPQVWRYGPVFANLYNSLKIFGRTPILQPQTNNPFTTPCNIGDDKEVRQLINWIWAKYGHLDSFTLSDMTHAPGTAWEMVANEYNYSVPFNMEIEPEYIKQEFSKMLQPED